jgi:hypothetical protein
MIQPIKGQVCFARPVLLTLGAGLLIRISACGLAFFRGGLSVRGIMPDFDPGIA